MELVLLFIAGVIFMSFVEYVHHRFAGHVGSFGKKMLAKHRFHHKDPFEDGWLRSLRKIYTHRFPQVVIVSTVVMAILIPLFGLGVTLSFMAGAWFSYGLTDYYHWKIHNKAPSHAIDRWLYRFHYSHHFLCPNMNFGFTNPFWDMLFGTYQKVDKEVKAPSDKVEAYVIKGVDGMTLV